MIIDKTPCWRVDKYNAMIKPSRRILLHRDGFYAFFLLYLIRYIELLSHGIIHRELG